MFKQIQEKLVDKKKRFGILKSNIILSNIQNAEILQIYENEMALAFTVQEPFRIRGYYAGADEASICDILQKVPKDIVVEYLFRTENDMQECFIKAGLSEYAQYVRKTWVYTSNPYEVPETGRRKLLQDLYDPTFGEYAQESDIQELYELTLETFDPICDDVFTKERWKEIVDNKECLIYREDGQIVTYLVWKREGKKFYDNLVINRGPANYLYNMERRIFTEMWERGEVNSLYAWYNMKNGKALRRIREDGEKAVLREDTIYNVICVK